MSKKLKRYFEEIQKIQDRHIAALNTESSELDTQKMLFERKRSFENLRNAISGCSRKVLLQFTDQKKMIQDKDEVLQKKLAYHREKLADKINKNACGKRLLKGYGGQSNQTKRFMNTKG